MMRITALLVLLVAVGCDGGAPASDVVRVDSAGVWLIDASDDRLREKGAVPLEPRPFAAALPQFGDLVDVEAAADGRLIALDPLEARVTVLDSTGAEAAVFGREGTGPGEFRGQGLSNVVVLGDSAFVPDPLNQRMTVHALSGDLARTFPLDLAEGITLDWKAQATAGLLVRRRGASPRIDLLAHDEYSSLLDLDWLDVVDVVGPLAPIPLWCVFPDGRLAVARSDRYAVRIYDAAALVTILRTDRLPEPLAQEGIEHVQSLMMESIERIPADQVSPELVERMLSGVIFPENAPMIGELACPTNEELWVQRARPVTEMDREVLRVGSARAFGGSTWDVWNVQTGAVRPVSVDANARITHVSPDLVVGFTTDALGVKTPARWGRR